MTERRRYRLWPLGLLAVMGIGMGVGVGVSTGADVQAGPLQLARLDVAPTLTPTRPDPVEQTLARLDLRLQQQPTDYEARLLKALVRFKSGARQAALQELDALLAEAPDFHLAYLVRGDLRLSQFQPVTRLGENRLLASLATADASSLLLKQLRDEARLRLRGMAQAPWRNKLPRQILALGDSVATAVLVDKRRHRLYVYRRAADGRLQMERDYYVSTGKLNGNKTSRGDLRTPEGVYFVTSWIPRDKLPDKYGVGAFPVNYPNELDRHLGKTGYGIWLHGTESRYYSRPPLDSEGCVVLTNMDLEAIKRSITPGVTPVVIAEQVDWIDTASWERSRRNVMAALEAWRQDWQSLDVERYLAHYAADFWSGHYDRDSWRQRKRQLAKSKTYQRIELSDISLLAYPRVASDGPDIVVARFRQSYQSNNFNSEMHKRLYLKRIADRWQIVYEGR